MDLLLYIANTSITEEEAENMISNKTTSMFVGNVCIQHKMSVIEQSRFYIICISNLI